MSLSPFEHPPTGTTGTPTPAPRLDLPPVDLARVHLLDQTDAAERDADRLFTEFSAQAGGVVATWTHPRPAESALMERMSLGLADGTIALCPHTGPRTIGPVWWCPTVPGKFRCTDCTARALRRIRAKGNPSRCDGCGQRTRGMPPYLRKVPAELHADELGGGFGPVLLLAHYCSACDPATPPAGH